MMVELRTPSMEDLPKLAEWQRDPEILALNPIVGTADMPLFWSIYSDGVLIGSVSVYNRSGTDAEIGIFIGDSTNWSQGYGSEAIRQLLAMCSEAGCTNIHLKVLPDNIRAIRCYDKCGFSQVGRITIDGMEFIQMSIMI